MTDRQYNVLILCTGNSARSILAEQLVNRLGENRFKGFSAGSIPTGKVNPFAIRLLQEKGYPVDSLRSKSWLEFSGEKAPKIDFVFTVCDNAASETCPAWPGRPAKAHWGIPDPASVGGSDDEIMAAFEKAYEQLEKRIATFVALPLETLNASDLAQELNSIGKL
jgi:arsenate reductase (thioredoxin)